MAVDEPAFRARYPVLHDFLDTVLWPGADGPPNAISLLVGVAWMAHPVRARAMVDELAALAVDDAVGPAGVAELFNRDGGDHPYAVVTPGNARDFCTCMAETLQLIARLRPA